MSCLCNTTFVEIVSFNTDSKITLHPKFQEREDMNRGHHDITFQEIQFRGNKPRLLVNVINQDVTIVEDESRQELPKFMDKYS